MGTLLGGIDRSGDEKDDGVEKPMLVLMLMRVNNRSPGSENQGRSLRVGVIRAFVPRQVSVPRVRSTGYGVLRMYSKYVLTLRAYHTHTGCPHLPLPTTHNTTN